MKILKNQIPKQSLLESEIVLEGPMIKAVVDVSKEIIAIDAEIKHKVAGIVNKWII